MALPPIKRKLHAMFTKMASGSGSHPVEEDCDVLDDSRTNSSGATSPSAGVC
ncbi:Hypothetical predicted protein [Pelobates cultripes]|uniref:Uncharacterized protein n=1 Tax=Pelobates cultripes TaxID=61616 RepID=A0AAD1RVH3_PELCU|nr:Hypothetical predicted protein [Pelobates cultripes]